MLSSTNTVCTTRKSSLESEHRPGLVLPRLGALIVGVCAICLVGTGLHAQDVDLRAPSAAVAGTPASIATTGSGAATFYLVGPSIAVKREVHLGQEIPLGAKELESAGKYIAIVCTGSCRSVGFFVAPAKPVNLAFIVHPSRAPVGENQVFSGVALPFDEFHNLVLTPTHSGLSADSGRHRSPIAPGYNAKWGRLVSHKFGPLGGQFADHGIDQ